MNVLFAIFVGFSIILAIITSPSMLLSAVGTAGARAVTLSASLAGIFAFWMGVIKILEKTPALSRLERMVSPIVSRIFPTENAEIRQLITMNITANMLGVGGASTPLAISAITKMKENATGKSQNKSTTIPSRATKSMIMLFVLNATSLQILPTTIISLRTSAGSVSPTSILIPTTIASFVATILGVALVWAFIK
ncbi:MAG: nucleoside recognition domain-containing protein [Bacillota bacterium]